MEAVGFSVDTGLLRVSGNRLAGISESLGAAFGRLEGMRKVGLGSARVDGALAVFADHWHFGWDVMRRKTGGLGAELAAAAKAYDDVEVVLGRTFSGIEA